MSKQKNKSDFKANVTAVCEREQMSELCGYGFIYNKGDQKSRELNVKSDAQNVNFQ